MMSVAIALKQTSYDEKFVIAQYTSIIDGQKNSRQSTLWKYCLCRKCPKFKRVEMLACLASLSNRLLRESWIRAKNREEEDGRRENACPQTPRFWNWNAPWYFTIKFICKLTARYHSSQYKDTFHTIAENYNKESLRYKKVKTRSDCCGISCCFLLSR